MLTRWLSKVSFRGKLVLATMGVVMGFMIAASLALSLLIEQAGARQIAHELAAGQRSYREYMAVRWRSLHDHAEFLRRMVSVLPLNVLAPNGFSSTLDYLDISGVVSFVLVTDDAGSVVGATHGSPAELRSVRGRGGIPAFSGNPRNESVWDVEDRLYLVATTTLPAESGSGRHLVVGQEIDSKAVAQIAQVTGRDVLVFSDGRLAGSSLRSGEAIEIEPADSVAIAASLDRSLGSTGRPLELAWNGNPRLGVGVPIRAEDPTGLLLITHDQEEIAGLQHAAYAWLLFCGLTIGGIGVIISLRLATRLGRPLRALMRAADSMAEGDFTARVETHARDDMGHLARSFNRMSSTIERLVSDVCEEATRAEAANRAKDSFLASVSHELRTPLAGMKAATEILLSYGPDCSLEESREFLEMLDNETNRLSRLIAQVLDFALIESGRMQWNVTAFDMVELAHRVVEDYRSTASERGMTIRVDAVGEYPFEGDRVRVGQIIGHLIDNACKYAAADSEVTVSIALAGAEVVLRVRDHGQGIPGGDAKRDVFDRFYQHGDTLTEKPAGAGLGLPICRELVAAHGGAIWCEDAPGGGAVFVVRLPMPGYGPRPIDEAVARERDTSVEKRVRTLLQESSSTFAATS